MRFFFELGNRYARKSNWKDFAFVKFCMCAIGVLMGMMIPPKHKVKATVIAGLVFITTYIPLMSKVFKIMGVMIEEEKEIRDLL